MSAIDQMCFTGETDCKFSPNMIKPNMCRNCMKNISKHRKENVTHEDILKALEYSQKGEKTPSRILEATDARGALFLGGFKAVVNVEFVSKENLRGVVNTAGISLFQLFGKKFENSYKDTLAAHSVECHYVSWVDQTSFDIPDEELAGVLRFVHARLCGGGAVLVHCAQGKSRSSTAVVAYLMVVMDVGVAEALAFVKERRKMAEPNVRFMAKLKEFEGSELRRTLHKEFSS